MTQPGKEAPKHCEVCGMPPQHKQTRKLKWNPITEEWICDVCNGKNELPPAERPPSVGPKTIWDE
jgi:hypothetical protein